MSFPPQLDGDELSRHRFAVHVMDVSTALLAHVSCLVLQYRAPAEWMMLGACLRAALHLG